MPVTSSFHLNHTDDSRVRIDVKRPAAVPGAVRLLLHDGANALDVYLTEAQYARLREEMRAFEAADSGPQVPVPVAV